MLANLKVRFVFGRLGSLEKGDDFEVWVWDDEWEIEVFCTSSVANDADIYGRHDVESFILPPLRNPFREYSYTFC